jgi:anti-anti-sigma factor
MKRQSKIIGDVAVEIIESKRAAFNDAEELKGFFIQYLEENITKVVVDLSMCEFIDSSFLGALIYGLKKMQETGGNLFLVSPKGDTKAILDISGSSSFFEIYNSVDEAVERLKNFNEPMEN